MCPNGEHLDVAPSNASAQHADKNMVNEDPVQALGNSVAILQELCDVLKSIRYFDDEEREEIEVEGEEIDEKEIERVVERAIKRKHLAVRLAKVVATIEEHVKDFESKEPNKKKTSRSPESPRTSYTASLDLSSTFLVIVEH